MQSLHHVLIRFVKWCYVIDSGGDPQPIRLHGGALGCKKGVQGCARGEYKGNSVAARHRRCIGHKKGMRGQAVGQMFCNNGCKWHKRDNRGCRRHMKCIGCKGVVGQWGGCMGHKRG